MKKIILGCAVAYVFGVHASDNDSSNDGHFYGGFSLEGVSSSSEYKMDFETNQENLPGSGGLVAYKRNGIKNPGYGVFLGFCQGRNYFFAAEAGFVSHTFNLEKEFNGFEALELATVDRNLRINTSVTCSYGDEYGASLKLGKNIDPMNKVRAYGILGASVRKVDVRYDYYDAVANSTLEPEIVAQYPHQYGKHIWAFAPGVGVELRIHKNLSLGLEYQARFYQNANDTKDLRDAPLVYPNLHSGDLDTRPRNYKERTLQHNLSIRFVLDLRT